MTSLIEMEEKALGPIKIQEEMEIEMEMEMEIGWDRVVLKKYEGV